MENSVLIEIRNVSKAFKGTKVLQGLNLDIHDKEFITLLGPSGCGKTTTLRIIGGFETPDEGTVTFEGRDVAKVPPYRRNVNTVFQKYALFPHLNVYDNIAFGLKVSKIPKNEIKIRVEEMLRLTSLVGFEKRQISTLSGGQQQRVAIARALVNQPKVLLLDEPLGALDLKLRKDMQNELKRMQKLTGITFIYVTHDQEEALSMSDTVVVMADGKIQQIGSPEDIYNEPTNAFVADFIGESNILDGVMIKDYKAKFAGVVFDCVDKGFEPNENVDIVIRPEDVDVIPAERAKLVGTVTSVTFKGDYYEIIVDVAGFKWMLETSDFVGVDSQIGLQIDPDAIHVMKKSEYSGRFGDYSTFSDEAEETNTLEGRMIEDYKVSFLGREFECEAEGFDPNEQVEIVIQSDEIDLVPVEEGMLTGTATSVVNKGDYFEIQVDVDGFEWKIKSSDEPETQTGDTVGLSFESKAIHVMKKDDDFSILFGDHNQTEDSQSEQVAAEETGHEES